MKGNENKFINEIIIKNVYVVLKFFQDYKNYNCKLIIQFFINLSVKSNGNLIVPSGIAISLK